jgi:pantothenate synthetase
MCFFHFVLQVQALQSENARLVESERETAAELSRRLTEIAARGQQAADTLVERDLLSSAVGTVQVQYAF